MPINQFFSAACSPDEARALIARQAGELAGSPMIEVRLSTDSFDASQACHRDALRGRVPVVCTGPVDRYLDYSRGRCPGARSTWGSSTQTGDSPGTGVMNRPDADVAYTRIIEPRCFHPECDYPWDRTVIMKEYSRLAGEGDEPYYPVDAPQDREMLLAYRDLVAREEGVFLGGRLGAYKYLGMHMTIGSALSMVDNCPVPFLQSCD
ncbi:UDP-galactopyranose mutase [Actinomyces viscosus]|uniref:UDP-galactopyranose mutase n=1 Tax=Actinomyces viscosus TaxID=1656 RepID=A0A448PKZ3_ACTVI|nr:UDP-galactopyranose mutase [Actinomyces viscosus]VEI16100.1 UDP-galactopyranose mutase [Actinomyces viscosus]